MYEPIDPALWEEEAVRMDRVLGRLQELFRDLPSRSAETTEESDAALALPTRQPLTPE